MKDGRLKVVLTHDVDWPPNGPGLDHILARKERFDPSLVERATNGGFNPYNNIDLIMDLERTRGLRSTFFFRPRYDDGTQVSSYSKSIKTLMAGGWEVGAHINNAGTFESVAEEKNQIAAVMGVPPVGCRVHYLKLGKSSHSFIRRAGFEYDSSLMLDRDQVSPRSAGYLFRDDLLVFPITIMDAYLFTYMKVPEEKVRTVFESAIQACSDRGYMTVLWHDSSVQMKGGRAYLGICELLSSRDDIDCVTAGEACRSVLEGETK